MRITATHIVAAIVGIVGCVAMLARVNQPDAPNTKVSDVRRRNNVKEVMDLQRKGAGR
jgi:hypothetical protein